MRESGILFPVFSLPSRYGIGSFSREAYEFVEFLEKAGQGFWQILPVGPTGYGNSPYQPFSAFAGNPYFISLEGLVEDGLLTRQECDERFFGSDPERVDYGALYENRFDVLRLAYERFLTKYAEDSEKGKKDASGKETSEKETSGKEISEKEPSGKKSLKEEFEAFLQNEAYWIQDYALFMTIKELEGGRSWLDWKDEYRLKDPAAMEEIQKTHRKTLDFFCFLQFEFERQWTALRAFANEKKVKIIGDLPFYVSLDSADAWSHPEVFQMGKDLVPTAVAGCPPDAFSPTGQLWGNPVYDWKYLKKDGYSWWMERIRRNYDFYDVIRIDHFHGFCDYYAIPWGEKTAERGEHLKGPGMDLFRALEKKLGPLRVIAEDLGTNTPENEKLLKDSGFPGMKVLQYAFTSWDSYYVTHKHSTNCVVYTGTHDNTPTRAWVEEIQEGERVFARGYINSIHTDYGQFVWDFIREAYRSVADLCIVPLQDYLCKGREARINSPGTSEGNWEWRLPPAFLSEDLCRSIRRLSEIYGRIPK